MSGPKAKSPEVSLAQRSIMEKITLQKTGSKRDSIRAEIVLLSSNGISPNTVAKRLNITKKTVILWKNRWISSKDKLNSIENKGETGDLYEFIVNILSDKYRTGTPPKFTAEQICQIIALACELPEMSGRPITHWTPKELADEAIRRGIVQAISTSTVKRILTDADLKPHQSRYWLNNDRANDEDGFDSRVNIVCDLYRNAETLHDQGVHVISIDEKTGIQALERAHPDLPMKPGKVECKEHSYERHGTQCLIANMEVATGQIVDPTVDKTRTEIDFVKHIAQTIASDSDGTWIFILDQLNTHKSESLVQLVALQCGITDDLGEKGKSGILESMESRGKFLEDTDHRVRFVYTPKHSSWMNQIEIWFSILSRKLLKRGSFLSEEHLRQKILDFIGYFNRSLAKPFKWTYAGRPLCA